MARLGTRTLTVIRWAAIVGLAATTYAGVSTLVRKPAERSVDPRPGPSPALTVPSSVLEFGEVAANRRFRLTLPLRNTSASDVAIADFGMSCPCVSVEPRQLVIPRGRSGEVVATLDLTRGFRDSKSSSVRFEAIVVPQGKDGTTLGTFPLHARVFRAITFDPPALRFDDEWIRGRRSPARSVVVTCLKPLASAPTVRCDPAFATVGLVALDGTERYRLDVRPAETLSDASREFEIEIDGTLESGVSVSAQLPVAARIVDDVACMPEAILVGGVPMGSTIDEPLILESRTGTPFIVDDVTCSSPDARIEPTGEVAPTARSYRVKQTVTTAGLSRLTLDIRLHGDGEGARPRTITVPVEYHGYSSSMVKGPGR